MAAAWWLGDAAAAILASPAAWAATIAALVVNHLLRFARWHWMLCHGGHHLAPARSLVVFLAGLAFLPTPGKAGVAVRSLLLRRDGVPMDGSLAAYFGERLSDFIGLALMATLLLSEGGGARWTAMLGVAVVVLAAVRVAPAAAAAMRERMPQGSRRRGVSAWLQRFARRAARLATGWRFWVWIALGMAANAATAVLLLFIVGHAGASIGPALALGTTAVAHLGGSLSLLPGGLGGFELAMLAQLHFLAIPAAAALAATAFVRVATIWGSVAVGLAALAIALRPSCKVRACR